MRDRVLIYASVFLRCTAIGSLKVYLGIYLITLGLTENQLGIVVSAGLGGVMLGTLAASFLGDRLGRRQSLALVALLNVAGVGGLIFLNDFGSILAIAFLGMINGMGKERGAGVALENAALPQTTTDTDRTRAFAYYNVVMDVAHGLGAVLGMLPAFLREQGVAGLDSYRITLVVYAALMALSMAAALLMTRKVELGERKPVATLTPETRKIVLGFAALSWLDSFGSGFIAGSILSVWISATFHVGEAAIGALYLGGSVANAISHFGAAWLSKKIGLVNTMVFTHIPSSLFLIAMAFAPTFVLAAVFYMARELLVEMDVPTRQSYLAGVVKPEERTAAAGLVAVARNLGWAAAPTLAGYVLKWSLFASPLVMAGALKIVYDLALWRSFRNIKPPEEV
jgi:MFS family permease